MSSTTIPANTPPINVAGTLRKFFLADLPMADALAEIKKLTPSDREDLISGILKINGEIVYSK